MEECLWSVYHHWSLLSSDRWPEPGQWSASSAGSTCMHAHTHTNIKYVHICCGNFRCGYMSFCVIIMLYCQCTLIFISNTNKVPSLWQRFVHTRTYFIFVLYWYCMMCLPWPGSEPPSSPSAGTAAAWSSWTSLRSWCHWHPHRGHRTATLLSVSASVSCRHKDKLPL